MSTHHIPPSDSHPPLPHGAGGSDPAEEPGLFRRLISPLFDLRFRHSLLAEAAGILYVVWIGVVLLNWLGVILLTGVIGFSPAPGSYFTDGREMVAPWLPVLAVLLGWIPALVWILIGRVCLELATAAVHSARDSRRSVELLEQIARSPR